MKTKDMRRPTGHKVSIMGILSLPGHLFGSAQESLAPILAERGGTADTKLRTAFEALGWTAELRADDDGKAWLEACPGISLDGARWTEDDPDFLESLALAGFSGSLVVLGEQSAATEYALGNFRFFEIPFTFDEEDATAVDGWQFPEDEPAEAYLARYGFFECDLGAGDFGYANREGSVVISALAGDGRIRHRSDPCQVSFEGLDAFTAAWRPDLASAVSEAMAFIGRGEVPEDASAAPADAAPAEVIARLDGGAGP